MEIPKPAEMAVPEKIKAEKDMPTPLKESPKSEPAKVEPSGAWAGWVLVVLLVGAACGVGGYFLGKNKGENSGSAQNSVALNSNSENLQNLPLINQNAPANSANANQAGNKNNPTSSPSAVLPLNPNLQNGTSLRGGSNGGYAANNANNNGSVLGAQTQNNQYGPGAASNSADSTNGAASAPAADRVYSNAALGFSLQIPSNWTIEQINSGTVFITPDKKRYSVQVYQIGGSGNGGLSDLRAFLASQPNIHNINPASFGGFSALAFQVDGVYQNGWAFLNNGKIYYILGGDAQTALSSFSAS